MAIEERLSKPGRSERCSMAGMEDPELRRRLVSPGPARARLADLVRRLAPARSHTKLTLWPLLVGICLLFAGGIAAVIVASWLAGREADAIATRQSIDQVERVLDARVESLVTTNLDWAYWNEAIEKFVLHPDVAYADENLGTYGRDSLGLHAQFVIDPADQPIFAYRDGEPVAADVAARWVAELAPLIARARSDFSDKPVGEKPVPVAAYFELDGQLVIVSASAMAPEAGSDPIDWPQPAVLVFMEAMDSVTLQAVGEAAGVQGLHPVALDSPAREQILLRGLQGDPVRALAFDLRLPSATIFDELRPMQIAIGLLLLCIGGLIAHRLLQLAARYQHEREVHEDALSRAMLDATAASHAKSQFLANMSHEIRTPLNGVIGYAEMLKLGYLGALNPKQSEYVSSIETAGRHLLALLQDVLDLAKIEAGREDLEESEVEVESIVAKAVTLVTPRARESMVAIVVESGAPARLRVDNRRVLQMLLNLLSNAIRFTPPGGTVRINWGRKAEGNFTISVIDSGPGIPEAELSLVTEPFHRPADSRPDARYESNGLGLPLTSRLARLHGGKLVLVNAPTGGLIATLQFPKSRDLGTPAPLRTPRAASR